jgi:hypothetical protein
LLPSPYVINVFLFERRFISGDTLLKLPKNTRIAPEKFHEYLLKKMPDNDKSIFLGIAGYTLKNWNRLADDIRTQLLPHDALLVRETPFGNLYKVRGVLLGPNGKKLKVVSIWMTEYETKVSKFITLYPDKEK